MYKIDTGQARTDLYGIGKGAAQVIDLSPLRQQAAAEEQRNFAEKKQKEKEAADKEADIYAGISSLNSMKIMPRDQELAAQKLQDVRDYVINNGGLRNATPAQMMEFQKKLGDAKIFSDLSQNHREALEQRGMELLKNPEKYRPEAIDYYQQQYSKDNAGNFDLDDSQFKQKFDYYGHLAKNLLPAAKSMADASQTPWSEKYSLEQAKDMIGKDISSNPAAADEAIYQFNKAEDKLGATTPSEYMQNKYAKDLIVNIRKAGPGSSGSGSGGRNEKYVISARYNKNGDDGIIDWEYVKPPDNPYLTTSIGEVRPGKIYDLGKDTYMEVTDKEGKPGKLGYEETLSFIHNKLQTSLDELRKGKAPSHIDLQNRDIKSYVEAGSKAANRNPKGEVTYSSEIENKINAVLNANKGAKREDVIKALKAAGKLK